MVYHSFLETKKKVRTRLHLPLSPSNHNFESMDVVIGAIPVFMPLIWMDLSLVFFFFLSICFDKECIFKNHVQIKEYVCVFDLLKNGFISNGLRLYMA